MAVDFDPASSEYINVKAGGIVVTSGDFSIALWVFADTTGESDWYAEGNTGNNNAMLRLVTYNPGTMTLLFNARNTDGSGEIALTATAVPTGEWVHLAVTRTGTTFALYINGAKTSPGATTMPNAITRNTTDLGVWRRLAPVGYVDGKLEDVRVFNRLLSDEEVAILAAGYRGPMGSEAGWWSMMDAQVVQHWDGDSLATTDVIPDMSGNGNDGTPQNTPTARASEAPRFGAMLGWG